VNKTIGIYLFIYPSAEADGKG